MSIPPANEPTATAKNALRFDCDKTIGLEMILFALVIAAALGAFHALLRGKPSSPHTWWFARHPKHALLF
jgi:hypothetical protein